MNNRHMPMRKQIRWTLEQLVFGGTLLPQEFTIGLAEPQAEIAVWLHGMGEPLDVTRRHSMICAEPFTMGIAFEKNQAAGVTGLRHLSLRFCERSRPDRALGRMSLRPVTTIEVDCLDVVLFEVRGSSNHCLPAPRLGAHYLLHAYSQWRNVDTSGIRMSFLEKHAAMVNFIRPHPVALVSVHGEEGGNLFPMNVMGELGHGYFAFGLKDNRRAAHLVERAGRLALSSVPLPQATIAFQLAANHKKLSIDWDQLPFALKASAEFTIPVPAFAPRVRELAVKKIHRTGSHTLFVAEIVSDQRYSEIPSLHVIHGFYQAWRLKGRKEELRDSIAADASNKRGYCTS